MAANAKVKRLESTNPGLQDAGIVAMLEQLSTRLADLQTKFNAHIHYADGNAGYSDAVRAAYQDSDTLLDLTTWGS